jgi:hypothetical protein
VYVTRQHPRYGEIVARTSGHFANSPAVRAARVATSRSTQHLVRRGLLAHEFSCGGRGGYLLTEAGIEVGRANARPVPLIAETIEYFQLTASYGPRTIVDPAAYVPRLAAELAKPLSVDVVNNVHDVDR